MLSRSALALLVAVALLRGSSYLPTQVARDGFSPASLIAVEILLTVLVAWVFAAARGHLRQALRVIAARPAPSLALAASLTGVPLTLIALAITDVSSGMAAILVAPAPIFGLAFGVLAGERLPWRAVVGALVGFAGVVVATGGGSAGSLTAVLALLAASACYAIGARTIRTWFADVRPEAIALAASLPALPVGVLLLLADVPDAVPPTGSIAALAVLGAANIGLGLVLWCALVRSAGPETALLVTYANPPVAMLLAALVAGEVLSLRELLGLVVVFAGIAMTTGTLRLPALRSRLTWTTSTSES
ncbi:EamA family transporter [Solirubrobacter phytolaccae]|uniref:EamA family transporter n=1 Tax=Solirubrobacter phytolaccae TaxID=1404360 RepID=A0A9X3SH01_9ACTN|nr:EamA family transporter [Solirubrobacter phytolaccae]MDA0182912.1 EamA family transporter [Solirubrobacter phytolaccae]